MFWNARPTEYDAESAWKKWKRFLSKFTANANSKFRLLFLLSNQTQQRNTQISSYYNKRRYFQITALKVKGRRQSWTLAICRSHTRGVLLNYCFIREVYKMFWEMRAPWLVRTSSLYFHKTRALRHKSALWRYNAQSLGHRYERAQLTIHFIKEIKKTRSSSIVKLYKHLGIFKNTREVRVALAFGSCFSSHLSCS